MVHGKIAACQSVDVVDGLSHHLAPIEGSRHLASEGAAAAVVALAPVHDRDSPAAAQGFGDLFFREGTEDTELEDPCFPPLLPQLVDRCFGSACRGAHNQHDIIGVLRAVFFKKAVSAAGELFKAVCHLQDDCAGVFHGVFLGLLGFHCIAGYRIGADGHGFSGIEKIFLRSVGPDKFADRSILQQLDIFHSVAGDKAVLADHHRQVHPGILRDRKCLKIIVIGFLVVFCVDLDPARVAGSHPVRMVAVDVDRTG